MTNFESLATDLRPQSHNQRASWLFVYLRRELIYRITKKTVKITLSTGSTIVL